MVKSLYEILNCTEKKSILKSYFISPMEFDDYSNVRINIEAFDDEFLRVNEKYGDDYILYVLENILTNKEKLDIIINELGLQDFKGALVTLYGETKVTELYFLENGFNQYGIDFLEKIKG